jgi:1,2-diacylglycerol 3-alpha-glucosyltransferase
MRVGLFTDAYHPTINGVVYAVESTRRQLEALGHEVYIFCPATKLRKVKEQDNDHVIRFRSIKGGVYASYDVTLFLPSLEIHKIRELDLDVIHYFSLGQVGMLAMFAGRKLKIPVVAQHCTDIYQFAKYYNDYRSILAGLVGMLGYVIYALGLSPLTFNKSNPLKTLRGLSHKEWRLQMVRWGIIKAYSRADSVIALSRKSRDQLTGWGAVPKISGKIDLLPNGVDALPVMSEKEIANWRESLDITPDDYVILSVGRLAAEKNLELLIDMMSFIIMKCTDAKLVFVGDFDYRKNLEDYAAQVPARDNIIFAGSMPRTQLSTAYQAADIFVMSSLTDTQGWVLHEAAHAGLPIVLVDHELSEVVVDKKNGFLAENNSEDVAKKVCKILSNKTLQKEFSEAGKKLASKFTEKRQTEKLIEIYKRVIAAQS